MYYLKGVCMNHIPFLFFSTTLNSIIKRLPKKEAQFRESVSFQAHQLVAINVRSQWGFSDQRFDVFPFLYIHEYFLKCQRI